MTERQSKISIGTVGGKPCEISLNSILLRENDARITNIIMRRYNYFRAGVKAIVESKMDKAFTKTMLMVWKHNQFAVLEKQQLKLPKDAYTHLRCCMVANYREALIKIKNEDNV